MYKVFISQPMKGKTREKILDRREILKDITKYYYGLDKDVEFIDSFFDGEYDEKHPLKLLGKAVTLMSDADLVVFDVGWEYSNGCTIEHECAVRYNKDILYLNL